MDIVTIEAIDLEPLEAEVRKTWRQVERTREAIRVAERARYDAGRARERAIEAFNTTQIKMLEEHWKSLGLGWCTVCKRVQDVEFAWVLIEQLRVVQYETHELNGLYRKHTEVHKACSVCRNVILCSAAYTTVQELKHDPEDGRLKIEHHPNRGKSYFVEIRNVYPSAEYVVFDEQTLRMWWHNLKDWGVPGLMEWDKEKAKMYLGDRSISEMDIWPD